MGNFSSQKRISWKRLHFLPSQCVFGRSHTKNNGGNIFLWTRKGAFTERRLSSNEDPHNNITRGLRRNVNILVSAVSEIFVSSTRARRNAIISFFYPYRFTLVFSSLHTCLLVAVVHSLGVEIRINGPPAKSYDL